MTAQRTLILGTHNPKKARELIQLLAPHGFELQTLAEVRDPIEVVEDGDSFAANAALKASQQAVHLRQWVLGEDSGLAVDALRGAPGVYSARYAGPDASDEENNARLLRELEGVPLEKRRAHYVCHAALADPTGKLRLNHEDYCHGRILDEPAGSGGFGYDPLFEIPEYHQTFAELGDAVKAVLSHRGRVIRAIALKLLALVEQGGWPAT